MKLCILFLLLIPLLADCGRQKPLDLPEKVNPKAEETLNKEIQAMREELKRDVRIKLKRDGKGNYSWEIQGKDLNEVLKINEALEKRLSE